MALSPGPARGTSAAPVNAAIPHSAGVASHRLWLGKKSSKPPRLIMASPTRITPSCDRHFASACAG